VLTRLPAGLAVKSAVAAELLARRFNEPALHLDDATRASLLERLARAGVFGGATYDGLVAAEAEANGQELLTLDRRAQSTYQRLGVAFSVISD
jgi:predicted nucleic acid-binding protein